MRRIPHTAAVAAVVVALAVTVMGHAPQAVATPRQSSQHWHSEVLVDSARNPVFSSDGTKIAFETFDGLLPRDTNGHLDVYIYDRATRTTELVSFNGAGTGAGNSDSWGPVFSPDGTTLVFDSFANDLGPTDTNGNFEDVYRRDLTTGETSLVSVNAAANGSGNGISFDPVFTPDGSGIAFTSAASDLTTTPDGNDTYDVFLRDLRAGRTELVSVDAAGDRSAAGASGGAAFTAGGSKLVFTSSAGDLGPVDGNRADDVYLRDLRTGATTLVSVNAAGTSGGDGRSYAPQVVGRGSQIVFTSAAADLGPTDTNALPDIYIRDLRRGTTELVSVDAAGTDSGNGQTYDAAVSPDGRLVAFATGSDNLGPVDPGDAFEFDIYVRDLHKGTTELVSANAAGTDGGNGISTEPVFSPDGRQLAFTSEADDLGPTDTNVCTSRGMPLPCSDVYVRNLRAGTTSLVSSDGSDSLASRRSGRAVFNPVDRHELAFASQGDFGGEAIHLATE